MPNGKKKVVVEQENNVSIIDQKEAKINYDNVNSLRPKHIGKKCPSGMRTFTVARPIDSTGVSGEGIVIEGVEFATGQLIAHWLTPLPHGSISIFSSLEDFIKIHIKPHPDNKTILTFDNGETVRFDD